MPTTTAPRRRLTAFHLLPLPLTTDVRIEQSTQMMPQSQHVPIDENEDEEDMDTLGSSSKLKSVPPMKKMKGPLDVMFGSNPRPRPGSKNERKTIFDAYDKAYSYKEMIEEIGIYGPGLVPPSMHELRVPLLKKKVDDVNLLMLEYKKEWAIKGCSILSNGWRDSVANKEIVNFLVNSPKGSVFLRSVDVSNITKDAYALLVGSLVKVLRMVDGERKPPIGYIYEAMDRAKEAIAKSFSMNEEHYKEAFEFIDRRWECQLHQPLHATGYFLNPEFYYANPEQVSCVEVEKGLYDCIERLSPDLETQDKIMFELDTYKNASGLFGNAMTIRHRKYNRTLQRRYARKDTIDPILLDDIDESNEWLIGKMNEDNSNEVEDLVFEGDDLTWNVVSRATGANEPAYGTRGASKTTKTIASSSSRVDKGKCVASNSRRLIDEIEDEDEFQDFGVEEEDEEEDIGEDKNDNGDGDDEFYDDDY
ncbi:hAT dimerization domain-containing protein / transposase-like protein [Perilla frutescens var. hirtella]|nr:hAT dimerization domain-containing protein / transposase-like protein [Perilla frutescens var. hirtella]